MFINLSATSFTSEQLVMAAKKRYRDVLHETDVADAMKDAKKKSQTLGQAVEEIVALYVSTDGHDRNLIKTQEELKKERDDGAKIGVIKALLATMRDKQAVEADLKFAVRMQINLRKLKLNEVAYGSDIVSKLVEEGYVLYNYSKTGPTWTLAPAANKRKKAYQIDKLTDKDLIELCPDLSSYNNYQQTNYRTTPRPMRRVEELESSEEY